MNKSGATMAKRIEEFLDPFNIDHMKGWLVFQRTGLWPVGMIPNTVWTAPQSIRLITEKFSSVPVPATAIQWAERYDHIVSLIREIQYGDYAFLLSVEGNDFAVRVSRDERYTHNDESDIVIGRKWAIANWYSDKAILSTCFEAVEDFQTCHLKKYFLYAGYPLFVDDTRSKAID